MEKTQCPKCGKNIKKNGYKVHITFCKGKEGEIIMEEPKEEPKVEEKAVLPAPLKEVKKKVLKEEPEEDSEEYTEDDGEGENAEESSNPVLMICITIIAVAIILGFFIFGRRPA